MQPSIKTLGAIFLLLALVLCVESTASGTQRWQYYGGPEVCVSYGLPDTFICADWFAPDSPEDGAICCVDSDKLPDNSFEDCAKIVGQRGPRTGPMSG